MSYKYIEFDAEGAIGVITLNRPEKRNALSLELLQELSKLLTTINSSTDIRVVIIKGEGKVFCAGHDISQLVDREMTYYKAIFDTQVNLADSQAYDYARQVIVNNLFAEDAREGLSAFLEKRKPTRKVK